ANARMDPDLVDIATFGEGFNIGPTVGFTLPVSNNLVLGASAGYTWRGSYDQDILVDGSAPGTTKIDPGEVLTVTGSLGYQLGRAQVTLTGAYSHETETTQDDVDLGRLNFNQGALYDPGDRIFGSAELIYSWTDGALTTLSISGTHTDK